MTEHFEQLKFSQPVHYQNIQKFGIKPSEQFEDESGKNLLRKWSTEEDGLEAGIIRVQRT